MFCSIKNGVFLLQMSGEVSLDNDMLKGQQILNEFYRKAMSGEITKIILDFTRLTQLYPETIDLMAEKLCKASGHLPVKRVKVIVPLDRDTGKPSWYRLRKKLDKCTRCMVEIPRSYLEYV